MKLPGERFLAAGLLVTLVACGSAGTDVSAAPPPTTQGPAADYPITIGEPYSVGGTLHTPADILNYDQVGVLAIDPAGGTTISASHHTLPLPCYVEVTSLETGRTVLVRVERRGPMDSNALLALSAGAAEQLGARADTPIRVRRVNPPEQERAMLRMGGSVPLRMDTPMSLVEVLKRKLPTAAKPPVPQEVEKPAEKPAPTKKVPAAKAHPAPAAKRPAPTEPTTPVPASVPAEQLPTSVPEKTPASKVSTTTVAASGKGFTVLAGTFASEANAERAAKALGGQVSKGGSFHIVRTGPFATRAEAQASLAKVKAAGYSDARIQTKD